MPRIYAKNQAHSATQGYVDFVNGVAAVPAAASGAIAYFTALGLGIDNSKHAVTVIDQLTDEQLAQLAAAMGVTYAGGASKQTIVRAIETMISTAKLTALTITSVAGTASGDTKITVAGEGTGQLRYKISDAAITAPLYHDDVSAWTAFTDGADITAATGKKVNVAETDANGLVVGYGTQTVTAKA